MNALIERLNAEPSNTIKSGFRMDIHDRIIIEGSAYRLVSETGEAVVLCPASGSGLSEQFSMATLSRLSANGKLVHELGYYLPDDMKRSVSASNHEFKVSQLTSKQRARYMGRYAQVMAVLELISQGTIRNNEHDIANYHNDIQVRAGPYLSTTANERQLIEHEVSCGVSRGPKNSSPRKNRGGNTTLGLELYHPNYLVKLVRAYEKGGLPALGDNLAKSGNRSTQFRPEEVALMMEIIQTSYLTLERKTIKATVKDVQRAFHTENCRRKSEGQLLMRVPGKDAIRSGIHRIDPLRVLIARFGREAAVKKLRPVGQGLQVFRPMERVEIDEWRIDLISIIHSGHLHSILGNEFVEAVGLVNEKDRWWLVAAIDCRTKAIVGMKLTRNPNASAARECLRMVVSDKGQWADQVGALTPWCQAGVPETLVADNGPAFKAEVFTHSCLDLGVNVTRTIAGLPGMRGTIERVFHTASMDLMPRLKGRTFGNVVNRGNYPAEGRACFDVEDLTFALIRWVVDIYHNSPHEGLEGRTPLEQWKADMASGNYPLRALPDTRSKRLAFGIQLTRTASKSGLTVMGVRYHSEDLATWCRRFGFKKVDIRWDGEDLGAIEIFLEGAWREVAAVHDRFRGVNVHVWQRVRRSLRAKSASRKSWEEETVFKAIDDIEALVAHKSAIFGIIDKSISEKEFHQLEESLFSSFETSATKKLREDGEEPGRLITPREPDFKGPVRNAGSPAARANGRAATRSVSVETPDEIETSPKTEVKSPKPHSRNLWIPQKPDWES
jgi:putative transposase